MSESTSEFQDFKPVVIRKKKTGGGGGADTKKSTEFAPVYSRASVGAGAGAGATDVPSHIKAGKKTSEHDDLLIPKQYLSSESRTELVHARTSRKMTQVELNNALSFPTNTINGIESGKYCPTSKQMDIINRYLGTKLHYGR